ncbi:AEC family transporter [Gordonia desulfuricans]|uniref:AEC family transporter n=1 Tax=Gordonia desulfuricans TaxID=89051 RepID=A0A7K3LSQ8_9ACTN|nr:MULTISPECIES: AEC family transporter [Gordonia]EMP13567.1 auxin efflux carrier [Gordonia sp. NB41Y]NDK91051.1 AEC family transporter [Gordonia desulfuricans]WLP90740.1 AEC family transporter [Gordonia sp. NB41Y]
MQLVTTAIIPIVLILALGAVLKRRFVTDDRFWRGTEWMSYHVFTPALFVESIAQTPLTEISLVPMVVSLAVPVLTFAVLLVALRRPMRADGPQLTSLVQGSVRINTYIGLVFASALHGANGIAAFALAAAIMVPLVNIVSVTTLSIYGQALGEGAGGPRAIVRQLVTNPLIQGCVAGLALNLGGIGLPAVVAAPIEMLAQPALVTGTLVAGAAITVRIGLRDSIDIVLTAALKLVALPLAGAAIASAFGVTATALAAIVIICAVPTAPSAYILARRMGGDARLMASITGAQTVLSVATLPLVLHLTAVS